MVIRCALPIGIVVILFAGHILSAPTNVLLTTTQSPITTQSPTTQQPVTIVPVQPSENASENADPSIGRFNIDDFVVSEAQYQQLLNDLYAQESGSVVHDPGNYVSNNASLEEILRLIDESNNVTTSVPIPRNSDETGFIVETYSRYLTSVRPQTTERDFASSPPVNYEHATTVAPDQQGTIQGVIVDTPSQQHGNSDSSMGGHDDCSICLDSLERDSTTFHCGHTFHMHCITTWAHQNTNCPMCRKPLRLQSGELLVEY